MEYSNKVLYNCSFSNIFLIKKNEEKKKDEIQENFLQKALFNVGGHKLNLSLDDEEEKERLKKVYAENEEKYFKYMREKYDPEKIFEKNDTIGFEDAMNEVSENLPDVAEYNHSIFKRIFRKIRRFFMQMKEKENGK